MAIKKTAKSLHLGDRPKFVLWNYKNMSQSKHLTLLIISRLCWHNDGAMLSQCDRLVLSYRTWGGHSLQLRVAMGLVLHIFSNMIMYSRNIYTHVNPHIDYFNLFIKFVPTITLQFWKPFDYGHVYFVVATRIPWRICLVVNEISATIAVDDWWQCGRKWKTHRGGGGTERY